MAMATMRREVGVGGMLGARGEIIPPRCMACRAAVGFQTCAPLGGEDQQLRQVGGMDQGDFVACNARKHVDAQLCDRLDHGEPCPIGLAKHPSADARW